MSLLFRTPANIGVTGVSRVTNANILLIYKDFICVTPYAFGVYDRCIRMKACNKWPRPSPAAGKPNALQFAENARWFGAQKWGAGEPKWTIFRHWIY